MTKKKAHQPAFKLGQTVLVTATTKMMWCPGEGKLTDNPFDTTPPQKQPVTEELPLPVVATVIGASYRRMGKYHAGYPHDDENYTPPWLEVTGTVLLYQLRTGLTRKPFEAMEQYMAHLPSSATY